MITSHESPLISYVTKNIHVKCVMYGRTKADIYTPAVNTHKYLHALTNTALIKMMRIIRSQDDISNCCMTHAHHPNNCTRLVIT